MTPASAEIAEEVFEDIGHRGAEIAGKASSSASPALLECGMTITIIGRALLRVGENLIGLVEFLEFCFGLGITCIAVRMMLHCELAKRRFQLGFACRFRYAENFIIIALAHRQTTTENIRLTRKPPETKTTRRLAAPGVSSIRKDFAIMTEPYQARFFLSSSPTSRNSASMTSSLSASWASEP